MWPPYCLSIPAATGGTQGALLIQTCPLGTIEGVVIDTKQVATVTNKEKHHACLQRLPCPSARARSIPPSAAAAALLAFAAESDRAYKLLAQHLPCAQKVRPRKYQRPLCQGSEAMRVDRPTKKKLHTVGGRFCNQIRPTSPCA